MHKHWLSMAVLSAVLLPFCSFGQSDTTGPITSRHHARIVYKDPGATLEHVIPITADSSGLWVIPYRWGRELDRARVIEELRLIPASAILEIRFKRKAGAWRGAGIGLGIGYTAGALVGKGVKALGGDEDAPAAYGVFGAIILTPLGAVIGGAATSFKIMGDPVQFQNQLPMMRHHCALGLDRP